LFLAARGAAGKKSAKPAAEARDIVEVKIDLPHPPSANHLQYMIYEATSCIWTAKYFYLAQKYALVEMRWINVSKSAVSLAQFAHTGAVE
jgi:hypothetical protein